MKEFRKILLNYRITPKWVIFLLDLLICIACFIYSNYLLTDFKIIYIDYEELIYGLVTVMFSSSLFFFLFGTFEGIIRFSETHEVIRAMSAVFCSFFVMLLINISLVLLKLEPYILNSAIFIYFFSASLIICGYRILVKTLYTAEIKETESVNVIIFGAETKGSLLQKTIGNISGVHYKVIAFIEDDEMLVGKTVNNIRIHSYKNLAALLKPFRVKMLFFSRPDISAKVKNKVVDDCLAHQVRVMNIPLVDGWMQDQLNSGMFKQVKIEELLGRPAIELHNAGVVNFLSDKNILITGAAGSIGSELARQVAGMNPASLIVCDQMETGLHDLEYELQKKYNLGDKLKVYLGDVKDAPAMEHMFISYWPDIVFHAAAYKHVPVMENHPSEAIRNNVLGTKVLADLSEKYHVDRFLFISTDKAINPTNIMGASKRIAEMYCNFLHYKTSQNTDDPIVYRMTPTAHKTKFITTRFGNVLASNGSVIPKFHEQIKNGGPVTVTHPDIIRYFMTIQEACSLVLEAATMGKGGEVLLFDMGAPVKILDLAKKMILLTGREPGKDISITFTGLRPGEKLYEELLNKKEQVLPTHHKKILIAKTHPENYQNYENLLDLIDYANACRDEDVVRQMKLLVPEYISNNSVYQLFDKSYSEQHAGVAQI